jgi:hypothetical protein
MGLSRWEFVVIHNTDVQSGFLGSPQSGLRQGDQGSGTSGLAFPAPDAATMSRTRQASGRRDQSGPLGTNGVFTLSPWEGHSSENQHSQEGMKTRDTAMSVWFRDDAPPLLLEDAVKIAVDFLDRTGEIDDLGEAYHFLVNKVGLMIAQGQRNRLLLSNRAISAFQQYRRARTIELTLVS